MNPSTAERVRSSLHALAPHLSALVDGFYDRLFTRNPQLRAIFPADMARQKYHLAAALALIGRNMDCLDVLEGPLMGLGAQHVRWGARPEHYPLVREALLDSLQEQAGPAWNDQLRRDWTEAINAIASTMLRGAARVATETARSMTGEQRSA
jgi:hemoglobin-like flavoprotein